MYKVLLETEVVRFISKLQKSTQSKYERLRQLLIIHGPDLGMPHARAMKSRLFELRIRGREEVRLFCITNGDEALIFYGFIKKTNKIPKQELKIILGLYKEII